MKRMYRLFIVTGVCALLLFGCTNPKNQDETESITSTLSNEKAIPTKEANPVTEEAKGIGKEDSEAIYLTEVGEDFTFYEDYEEVYEAEDSILKGRVIRGDSKEGFLGTGYVDGFQNDGDGVEFIIEIPTNGFYDLNFISASYDGYKENNIIIDREKVATVSVESKEFTDSIIRKVYLDKGEHSIILQKYWGWIYLDYLKVSSSPATDESIFKVSKQLINPNADDNTKRLMSFLVDTYGTYTISGQYADKGRFSYEFFAIEQSSGKLPAMLGLDLIEYSPSRVLNGSTSKAVEYAIEFDKLGGIVTFCWHWNAPNKYLTTKEPWWRGFYKEGSTLGLDEIMNKQDEEGYDLLVSDIDAIAVELKRMEEAGVPVLFRPLHEASGGWFWWGGSGPEAFKELWYLVYDRLTNYHQINNLIWVWNGQHKDWYPGDEYVDIIGEDIYPGERVYTSQVAKFNEAVGYTEAKKIVALTENGCLFDPNLAYRDDARWAWFTTWSGEFVINKLGALSEKYTEEHMIEHVYNHEKVLTLDELPDLKEYPME